MYMLSKTWIPMDTYLLIQQFDYLVAEKSDTALPEVAEADLTVSSDGIA